MRADWRKLPREEKLVLRLSNAERLAREGRPEYAYRIYQSIIRSNPKLWHVHARAGEVKSAAVEKADSLMKKNDFINAEKIYSAIGEKYRASIAGKREAAYKEALKSVVLGQHGRAEKYAAELAKLGAYDAAAELYLELANVAKEMKATPKYNELAAEAKKLQEREEAARRRPMPKPK